MYARMLAIRVFALALLVLLLSVQSVWAQGATGTISGTVRNATTNQPLPGMQVVVRGTQRGSLTDREGRFIIVNVPAGTHRVEASSIGFERTTQEVTVSAGETARVDLVLRESAVALEGVVVTGTGTGVERRKLSAPVDVITAQAIEQAPVTDVGQLLQGRVPGATVQAISAQPGQAPRINFRGVTSVFGSQTPVIYIDGVRVDNRTGMGFGTGGEQTSAIADILASDIDRIEVTKGGAASTLYGADAASGVIQIFTRRGVGAPRLTARIEQGIDQPETKFIQDAGFAFPDLAEESGFNPNFVRDEFLRTGYFQNYHVGASGGTERATYNISGRIQHSEGVQPKNDGTIFALRGGVRAEVNERLSLDFTGNYTRNNYSRIFNGTALADPLTALEVGDILFFSNQDNLRDALDVYLLPDIDEQVNRFTFGTTATFVPLPIFSSRMTVGLDYRASEQRILEPIDFVVTSDEGRIDRYNRDYTAVTLDLAGTLSYPQEGAITSDLTFGVQGFREEESQIFATGRDFALPGAVDFGAAATITASEANQQIFNGGFYFLERVGLRDVLFVEGALRLDGNSAFGGDVGLQAYPKFGVAYNISDEGFWQGGPANYLNILKLRAAYGQTGKFPQAFVRDRTFTATPFRGESAPRFDNPGNPDLRPERVATTELGFDAGLLDGRVGVNFTWFDAVTTDALFFVREQPATGQTSQLRNTGEISNRGIEVSANVGILRTPNFDWSIGANYNTVRNEVTSLGGQEPFAIGIGGRVDEGYPVGAYYVNHPVDTNGDGLLDGVEQRYAIHPQTGKVLSPTPTQNGSINTDVRLFNALTLNALADWARGGAVVDYGSAWATFNALERVVFPMRHDLEGNEVRRYTYTQAFNNLLMSGDYWKLREIGARYTIAPQLSGRIGADRATVYASIRNVYTWVPRNQAIFAEDARRNLIDPELSGVASGGQLELGGAQSITLPPPRQFRLGIEFGF